jgi:hypothetical protein
MKRENSLNIFNSIKEDVNNLIEKLPIDKLTKEDINNIIDISIKKTKKYKNLPNKYKECLNFYINGKIDGHFSIKFMESE